MKQCSSKGRSQCCLIKNDITYILCITLLFVANEYFTQFDWVCTHQRVSVYLSISKKCHKTGKIKIPLRILHIWHGRRIKYQGWLQTNKLVICVLSNTRLVLLKANVFENGIKQLSPGWQALRCWTTQRPTHSLLLCHVGGRRYKQLLRRCLLTALVCGQVRKI